MNFYMPAGLITGFGCIEANKDRFAAFGKKCIIITGASSARKCGAYDKVVNALNETGVEYTVFDKIGPNPLLSVCMEAGIAANEAGAEFVIGIGGGSPLDAAKAVAVLGANPGISEDVFYSKKWERAPLPIVLVGTTAGTGSEVTAVSVVTDSKGRKHSLNDPRIFASLSFGDPAFTQTMSTAVTLSTAVDALAHCVESYFSKKGNDISRACAAKGISILSGTLPAIAAGKAPTAGDREKLYNASILGGIAISVTGTCFPHNVGYYLTESRGLPHGAACAVFMPDIIDHAAAAEPELSYRMFREADTTPEELKALAAACLPVMNIHMTEAEIDGQLPRWENAGAVVNTVGNVTTDFIKKMLVRHFC